MPEKEAETDAMRESIHQFLQENHDRLTGIICSYAVRMGLAGGENARLLAAEVFQDAALTTLSHTDQLDPEPHAWFLCVAANILKRKRAVFARRYRFEVLVGDLADRVDVEGEGELFDQLVADRAPGPEQLLEAREQVQEMLAMVSEADSQILRMTFIQDLSAETIARQLGVKTGAVRVRLHRALQRLRIAWNKREEQQKRGQDYA